MYIASMAAHNHLTLTKVGIGCSRPFIIDTDMQVCGVVLPHVRVHDFSKAQRHMSQANLSRTNSELSALQATITRGCCGSAKDAFMAAARWAKPCCNWAKRRKSSQTSPTITFEMLSAPVSASSAPSLHINPNKGK
jgi:hypothetical protein